LDDERTGGAALMASAQIIRARPTPQQSAADANRYAGAQTEGDVMEYS